MSETKQKLAYAESIGYLWGYPDADRPRRPDTQALFRAIADEAEACLLRTNWEDRVRRIENILVVIKGRMRRHWEERHEVELDRLVRKAKKEREKDPWTCVYPGCDVPGEWKCPECGNWVCERHFNHPCVTAL
jgi:hypothetical protein